MHSTTRDAVLQLNGCMPPVKTTKFELTLHSIRKESADINRSELRRSAEFSVYFGGMLVSHGTTTLSNLDILTESLGRANVRSRRLENQLPVQCLAGEQVERYYTIVVSPHSS